MEAQTDVIQLQTPQHQTWLAKNKKTVATQVPEKAGRTAEQHLAEKFIRAAKILKMQHTLEKNQFSWYKKQQEIYRKFQMTFTRLKL